MIVVVVGDRDTVFDKIKQLPFEVKEVDVYGNPIN